MVIEQPRIAWIPPSTSSVGAEAVKFCRDHALNLDGWQEIVLAGSLGMNEAGKWSAFEVGLNVSRQNGKGGVIEGRELAGIFLLDEQLIVHSAHQFDTSMEAFLRMEALLEEGGLQSELKPRGGVIRSHGAEGFVFKSGQRIRYRTRTKGGGRGFTGDCLILDEAMFLPVFTIGALLPTLSAMSMTGNPQVWYTGSAVDQQIHDDGLVFARIRARGLAQDDPSLAYFEWSAKAENDEGEALLPDQLDDELLDDRGAWTAANPALGIRISAEHIQHERRSMDSRTFAVERLGIGDWPAIDADVLALEQWDELVDGQSLLQDPICLAFDVSLSRTWSSISAAGKREDGLEHVEVIENRRGTGWVVDRLAELVQRHRPFAVVCDKASPAASLVPELEEANVTVEQIDAREYANACGLIFDKVEQGKLRHLGQKEMRDALRGAATRPLGDAWAWSRKSSSADITPLVSCTLAIGKSATHFGGGEYVLDYAALLEDVAA